MAERDSATVETLTAEVRTLVVGSRQVTLSVYRQLDHVGSHALEPFGRVNPGSESPDGQTRIRVVGRHLNTGALVRSAVSTNWPADEDVASETVAQYDGRTVVVFCADGRSWDLPSAWREVREVAAAWEKLPLIVLAGLR